MAIAACYQMNGFRTNIHIPERNLNVKIQKISVEIGNEVLKKIGYGNSGEKDGMISSNRLGFRSSCKNIRYKCG